MFFHYIWLIWRYLVTQHLKIKKHKSAEKRKQDQTKNKSQQLVSTAMTSKKGSFNHELCETLLSANIYLNKLNNPKFRDFLLKYTGIFHLNPLCEKVTSTMFTIKH